MARKKVAIKRELEKFRKTQEINYILARSDAQSRALLETAGGETMPSDEMHASEILGNYGVEEKNQPRKKRTTHIRKPMHKAKVATRRPTPKAKASIKKKAHSKNR
ncbi:MAG: hypothetical protein QXF41_00445 [Candidatus Micrarchaeaceae archaeon]